MMRIASRSTTAPQIIFLVVALSAYAAAADWPMYRGNAARSGHTDEALPGELHLRWVYKPTHAPKPAWPRSDLSPYDHESKKHHTILEGRMPFDRAFHPAVVGDVVYFGSSADGVVRTLAASTGEPGWTFCTDGPVRFAPAVAGGRVFVVSDDGHLYCLAADTGKLLWKRRGGPNGRMVLGNERMVSRWPARGGPVVNGDIVYFAAGIWPTEGVYVYALRIDDGAVIWSNDQTGSIRMRQPKNDTLNSGVASQGYLALAGDKLLVTTGRSLPAAFALTDGRLLYYHLFETQPTCGSIGGNGGSEVTVAGDFFFDCARFYALDDGAIQRRIGIGPVAALPTGIVRGDKSGVTIYDWVQGERVDRKGTAAAVTDLKAMFTIEAVPARRCVIVAGQHVVAGDEGIVTMADLQSQQVVWSVEVEGTVFGLAAAGGRLYASTDRGQIYCFDGRSDTEVATVKAKPAAAPYGNNEAYALAAEQIISESGITEGYCLDLDCGDGALAYELAKRTRLYVYAVTSDPRAHAAARSKLSAAGLYGERVTVHLRDLTSTDYPDYFADLIVSAQSVTEGDHAIDGVEAARLQRPCGGVICMGRPGEMRARVRPALPGAGSWTHQYADTANTDCSNDTVRGPLRPLWYRQFDHRMPNRHGRGPAPLFLDGRIFSMGRDALAAVDAYNGRHLWTFALEGILKELDSRPWMGTSGTHANYCASETGVYVRRDDQCLRIDTSTGQLLGRFAAPAAPGGDPGTWAYVACDDGILFGSLANTSHVIGYDYYRDLEFPGRFSESTTFFAMDAESGKIKWRFDAEHSIRHNAIAIGGGIVYLIDRPLAMFDRRANRDAAREHAGGLLKAFDAKTGEMLWQSDEDIYGTCLSLSVAHGVLLMSYQTEKVQSMALRSEAGGRMTTFDIISHERLWQKQVSYSSRPVINDRTILAESIALDLLSGESRPLNFSRGKACGPLSAGKNLLLFRSEVLGYYDLVKNEGTQHFGGIRPGCWINALAAGGLVLLPDASDGCVCPYQNKTWLVLQTDDGERSAPGTTVK